MGAAQIVGSLAACVAVGAGCAAAAGAIWLRVRPRPSLRADLAEPVLALLGLGATASALTVGLLLAWGVPLQALADPTLADPVFVASLLGTLGGHLAVLAWARSLRAPLAVTRVEPGWWLAGIGIAGATLLASAGWGALLAILEVSAPDQALVSALLSAPADAGQFATIAFVVLGAPLLEELVFRGYLQSSLAPRIGGFRAGVISAACFGLFHLSDPLAVPVLTVMGGLLAWARARSGSIVPGLVGHVANNALALAIVFYA